LRPDLNSLKRELFMYAKKVKTAVLNILNCIWNVPNVSRILSENNNIYKFCHCFGDEF
jgi:hypothetical protein